MNTLSQTETAYQIVSVTKNLTIGISLLLSAFLTIICIGIVILIEYGRRDRIHKMRTAPANEITKYQIKTGTKIASFIFQGIAFFCAFAFAIYFAYGCDTYANAKKHGMYQSPFQITWEHTIKSIQLSPLESTLPDNTDELKGSLIMYFKFGCPDCEAIYQEQTEKLKDIEKLYWVSTRSAQGKKLLETYPVQEVPAGVYVKQNGTGVIETIYAKDANKNASLEKSKLNTLIDLYYGQN